MLAPSVESQNDSATADGRWTPELQLATTLSLCEAQMESALQESDHAVDELIKIFRRLAETTEAINSLAGAVREQQPDSAQALQEKLDAATKHMAAAVVAFQFYDKLTQRVGHVRYSLSTLAQFVCDPHKSAQPEHWQRLLNTLRRLYRTEEERQVFQMITAGSPADEAREHKTQSAKTQNGSVELF